MYPRIGNADRYAYKTCPRTALAIIHVQINPLTVQGSSFGSADNLDARATGNLECVARNEGRKRGRQTVKRTVGQQLQPYRGREQGRKGTHKRTPPAASSGVAARPRGMPANGFGPLPAGAWGIPRATFLPSISIEAPASFAAVNLYVRAPRRQPTRKKLPEARIARTVSGQSRTRRCSRARRTHPTPCRSSS